MEILQCQLCWLFNFFVQHRSNFSSVLGKCSSFLENFVVCFAALERSVWNDRLSLWAIARTSSFWTAPFTSSSVSDIFSSSPSLFETAAESVGWFELRVWIDQLSSKTLVTWPWCKSIAHAPCTAIIFCRAACSIAACFWGSFFLERCSNLPPNSCDSILPLRLERTSDVFESRHMLHAVPRCCSRRVLWSSGLNSI